MKNQPGLQGQRGDRRVIASWALFDFANSPFTTLVVTFVYASYFTEVIAPDSIRGTALWSRAVTLTALVVAFLSPWLGALADRGGYRKRFLAVSTLVCVAGSFALFPWRAGQVTQALAVFVVANVAFEVGQVFYNAFLPDIAPPGRIGRISGYGWALGYVGGLAALVLALVGIHPFRARCTPWFGLSRDYGENIRATSLIVGVWFALFSLPFFFWVKEDRSRISPPGSVVRASFRQIGDTFREIRRYRQMVRFLVARLFFNDALITVFAFGGIYAAGTFGFSMKDIVLFGIVLNVAAGLGAFGLGFLDDRLGGKRTVTLSLWGLSVATLLAVVSPGETGFWIAGVLIGVFAGPNQSASRSLMGRFVPEDKESEFFGFFAFSGKATAFVGPLLLGILTQAFGSQRAGVVVVLVLFVGGLIILSRVDEAEGVAAAGRNSAGPPSDP